MQNLEAVLGPDGPLARSLPGFTPRPAQQQMAQRVDSALHSREVLLVEAGTGTGKTYAYLVPALLSGLRVLISTGTRTLQDQLFHRDLPMLGAALGRPARVALLKGRSNYLCRARLGTIGRQQSLLPAQADVSQERVIEWSLSTRSGDLAELTDLSDSHPLRAQLSSTRESCSGMRCSEFARCHVFQARRAALDADIVVVNHHLLLADLALKEDGFGDLLPSVDALILDEAHQLPDLASEFFGVHVSSRQLELLLADLNAELAALGLTTRAAQTLSAPFAQALSAAQAALGREERQLAWQELLPTSQRTLLALQRALMQCADALEAHASQAALAQCALRARALGIELLQLLSDPDGAIADELPERALTDAVLAGARTVSTSARGFTLRLLPYEIATRFQAFINQARTAWIFTSATLAVRDDFSHFANRLGVQSAATLRLDSPFDFKRQALLYLPPGLPSPSDGAFTDAVATLAAALIGHSQGGAFVLFTSHRALRQAARQLQTLLPSTLPLLVQGAAPREQLLRQFRASGEAVLLGTASFWEGVDVQGQALRLVIIDKLPFASPEDPVVRSRIEHLNSQGASPFKEYQLPEAVLALKQGVGRLIRSEQDRGVVVICDPRLTQRSYGQVFRASLPPMAMTRDAEVALARLQELGALALREFGRIEQRAAAALST